MAKKFSPAPGVAILFDRTHEIEVSLPSGRTMLTTDEAPTILIVSHGTSTSYFSRSGETWTTVAEEMIGEIIDELEIAEPAKRAPKF